MGQPQQVFDDILSYIHREAIFPKFTEHLMLNRGGFDNDQNFKILNEFDNFPCHPPCPAHRCFSFELCEQGVCLSCKMTHPETVRNITVENNIRLYVAQFAEFISIIKTQRLDQNISLEDIMFYHFRNNVSAMKKTKFSFKCSCKGKFAAYQKWCIEVPTILTILLEWPPSVVLGEDPKESTLQMQKLLKMITPVIDIRNFLNVGQKKIEAMNNYVLRGFITYYGRHYIAYFYLEMRDVWVKFDDAVIKEIGSFTEVEERILKGREMIVQIFYESQLFIENVIAQQNALQSYQADLGVAQYPYFSKKARKLNKFFRGKNSDKNSNCDVF